jgi:hypothetical protein
MSEKAMPAGNEEKRGKGHALAFGKVISPLPLFLYVQKLEELSDARM